VVAEDAQEWGSEVPAHQRAERLSHALYGLIIVTATLMAERSHVTEVSDALGLLLGTALVLLLAHTYSAVMAERAVEGHSLGSVGRRIVVEDNVPVLIAIVAPAVLFILAGAEVMSLRDAYTVSIVVSLMALFGLDPALMKPAALIMNIFVTLLVLSRLSRAGHFNWRLFIPFIIGSIPMAFIGGALTLNSGAYKVIVGLALILAMWRMLVVVENNNRITMPKIWVALPVGGFLGFISGLTGVGGGIFLSPLLLLFNWTNMRGSAAIAARCSQRRCSDESRTASRRPAAAGARSAPRPARWPSATAPA